MARRFVGLEITLAGDVTIRDGGSDRLPLTRARARVAFALLTLERAHGVPREVLAEAVWPKGVPRTWESALRTVVSDVRSVVTRVWPGRGDPVLATAGRYQLLLPDDVLVDVELAEGAVGSAQEALARGDPGRAADLARRATAVLRAPFLADHDAEWVLQQQNRLSRLLLVGLETASQAAAAVGDGPSALAAADEAIAREPLRESAHRCRMAAHAVAGNRAEALKAYQHLRRMLADEFGADPSPETEKAYIALLGPTPTLPPPTTAEAEPATARVPPASPVPFVGRDEELAALAAAWDRAVADRACQVVLVTGDTGIGKTRLVTTAAQRVTSREGLVLLGRCDRDPTIAYQPFVEMLDGFVAAIPEDELPRLDPVARADLAAVFPSFDAARGAGAGPGSGTGVGDGSGAGVPGAGAPGAGAASAAATPGDRGRLFDAVADLLVAATVDRAVAVVLDDLQWADDDSLLLLRHVLQRARDAPLLVVAVARDPGELARPLGDLVRTAERDGRLGRIALDGLPEADVRALVERLRPGLGADADHLARRLVADTAGNPFMLVELLREGPGAPGLPGREAAGGWGSASPGGGGPAATPGAGQVPTGVQDLVEDKLAALDPAGRDLLRAASVAGTSFELDLVAATAGLGELDALDALDRALASRVVAEVGELGEAAGPGPPAHRYRFTHEIVQRTLYEQLSAPRRRLLHTRLADAIETRRSEHVAAYTPLLARHRTAAAEPGGDPRAVRWARAAARLAERRRATAEALRLQRQALDHVPAGDPGLRAEVLVELGLAHVEAGVAGGERVLLDAAVHARRAGRLDAAARAALGLADLVRTPTGPAGTGGPAGAGMPTAGTGRTPGQPAPDGLRAEAATLVDDVLRELDAAGAVDRAPEERLVHARLVARHVQLHAPGASGGAGTGAGAGTRSGVEVGGAAPPAAGEALEVLRGNLATRGGPPHLDERLALADDLAAVAAALDDGPHRAVAAHHRAMVRATVAGGPPQAALPPLLPVAGLSPADGAVGGSSHPLRLLELERDVAVAVTQGRFAEAREVAARVVALLDGPAGATPDAPGAAIAAGISPPPGTVAARQMVVARWLQDPAGATGNGMPDGPTDDPAEEALVALLRGDLGRARLAVRAAAHDPGSLPGGDRWLHSLGLVALVAVDLQAPAVAAAAYDLLAPHAGRACGVGYRSFVGTVTFHLGRLASVVGNHADAERHLMAALQEHSDSQARPWIALTQHALADTLEARSRAPDRGWVAVLRGESRSLARALGLRPLG